MSATDDAQLGKWRDLAIAQLRGKPLESLSKKTYDGVSVEPLYGDGPTRSDLPGRAPFVRGGTAKPGWQMWRRVDVSDIGSATEQLEEAAEAHAYIDTGRRKGAVVLTMGD